MGKAAAGRGGGGGGVRREGGRRGKEAMLNGAGGAGQAGASRAFRGWGDGGGPVPSGDWPRKSLAQGGRRVLLRRGGRVALRRVLWRVRSVNSHVRLARSWSRDGPSVRSAFPSRRRLGRPARSSAPSAGPRPRRGPETRESSGGRAGPGEERGTLRKRHQMPEGWKAIRVGGCRLGEGMGGAGCHDRDAMGKRGGEGGDGEGVPSVLCRASFPVAPLVRPLYVPRVR